MRYLIPRIAVFSMATRTTVTRGNAEHQLRELAHRVFDQDAGVWRGIVSRQIATCLREAQSLSSALSAVGYSVDKIQPGVGDPHGNGRTTTKIVADDSVYYFKPNRSSKRLLLESFFQSADISDYIHAPGDIPVLDGYLQESVPDPNPSITNEEFWHRAGAFAAAADCLSVIDLHYDNIAPAEDSIAFIDDETVLTVSPFERERNLLTTLLVQDPSTAVSGLAAGFMAVSTPSVSKYYPTLQDVGPGGHLTVRMSVQVEGRPTAIGRRFGSMCEYVDEFVEGLRHGYRNIILNRQSAASAIRGMYDESKSRAIFYSTPGYLRLSTLVSTSPTSATQRDISEKLTLELTRHERISVGPDIIRSEARQLMRGDIPMFTVGLTSKEISDGDNPLGEVRHTPVEESSNRLFSLDDNYVDAQCAIARQCSEYISPRP